MSTRRFAISCFLVSILSIGIGIGASTWYWTRRETNLLSMVHQANAGQTMYMLSQINKNKFDETTLILQIGLDSDITALGFVAQGKGEDAHQARLALKRIAKWRKSNPYNSASPEIAKAVQTALELGL